MTVLLFTLFGLLVGSFLGALSYRLPRNISIAKGRSLCPNCHSVISWHDNIPAFSYWALGRRCRNCKKEISPRYFLIECSTAFLFGLVALTYPGFIVPNLTWLSALTAFGLPFVIFLLSLFILIFIIDIEHQIIPDIIIFWGIAITLAALFLTGSNPLFENLFFGTVGSLFLLSVFLLTKGRGMGLGDVKLSLLLGIILGEKVLICFFTAFLTGAVVGIILMMTGKAGPKTKIAFGPFLVFGFLIAFLFGNVLWSQLFWYL